MHLRDFSIQNRLRDHEAFPSCKSWTPADYMLALFGEAGEASNIMKKINRDTFSVDDANIMKDKLGEELADVLCYLDMLAGKYNIDLEEALIKKWNQVSRAKNNPRSISAGERFWYVASPYTKYPAGCDAAFDEICVFTAKLEDLGISCFSPIAHSHPLARYTKAANTDTKYWQKRQIPFMDASCGLIVCGMTGYDESDGVANETKYFQEILHKPILRFLPKDPIAYIAKTIQELGVVA